MHTSKGFTLIEILIVLVIIGITIGFAIITFGDFGASKRILFASEQLMHTLTLAQQQAMLETTTLGLKIDNNSYQILKFDNVSSWKPLSNKGIFKVKYFPKNTVITVKTNNKTLPGGPTILINASGEMTPFTLTFSSNEETMAVLTGSHNGNLNFSLAKSK